MRTAQRACSQAAWRIDPAWTKSAPHPACERRSELARKPLGGSTQRGRSPRLTPHANGAASLLANRLEDRPSVDEVRASPRLRTPQPRSPGALDPALVPDRPVGLVHVAVGAVDQEPVEAAR